MNYEHAEQAALFSWAAIRAIDCPELGLMFAIPNERRNKQEAIYMKEEGVKAGVPDICLPVARGKYHGFYLELKACYPNGRKGELRAEQRQWLERLARQGYYTCSAWGWEDAAGEIECYLRLK